MRKRSVSSPLLVAAVLALASCGRSPTAPARALEITPLQPAYEAGGYATLELHSLVDDDLGYNLCGQQLQRLTSAGWQTEVSLPGPGGACTLELRLLPGGATTVASVALDPALPAGTWRVIFAGILYPHDGTLPERDRTSAGFQVTRGVPVN